MALSAALVSSAGKRGTGAWPQNLRRQLSVAKGVAAAFGSAFSCSLPGVYGQERGRLFLTGSFPAPRAGGGQGRGGRFCLGVFLRRAWGGGTRTDRLRARRSLSVQSCGGAGARTLLPRLRWRLSKRRWQEGSTKTWTLLWPWRFHARRWRGGGRGPGRQFCRHVRPRRAGGGGQGRGRRCCVGVFLPRAREGRSRAWFSLLPLSFPVPCRGEGASACPPVFPRRLPSPCLGGRGKGVAAAVALTCAFSVLRRV